MSSINEYQKARRSGRYTHPRQQEIFDEGPRTPGFSDKPSVIPDFPWKRIGLVVLAIFLAVTAYRWFSQPQEFEQITDQVESIADDLFTDAKNIKIETQPVPQYVAEQNLAFEKLKAWERLTKRAIDQFYAVPIQPGYKRTLCIAVDGIKDCKSRSGSVNKIHQP